MPIDRIEDYHAFEPPNGRGDADSFSIRPLGSWLLHGEMVAYSKARWIGTAHISQRDHKSVYALLYSFKQRCYKTTYTYLWFLLRSPGNGIAANSPRNLRSVGPDQVPFGAGLAGSFATRDDRPLTA